jgi:hypothetical protein
MSSGADLLAELKASDAAWIVEELDAASAAGLLCAPRRAQNLADRPWRTSDG